MNIFEFIPEIARFSVPREHSGKATILYTKYTRKPNELNKLKLWEFLYDALEMSDEEIDKYAHYVDFKVTGIDVVRVEKLNLEE